MEASNFRKIPKLTLKVFLYPNHLHIDASSVLSARTIIISGLSPWYTVFLGKNFKGAK